jgi:hypothetical protein
MAANCRFGASCGLSQVENGLTVCRASCRRPGQPCYHHHRSKKPVAFADLVEPASPLVVDAMVQELEEGVDYIALPPPDALSDRCRSHRSAVHERPPNTWWVVPEPHGAAGTVSKKLGSVGQIELDADAKLSDFIMKLGAGRNSLPTPDTR